MVEPFRVLVADPPWRFGDGLPGKTRGSARQYDVMTVGEIAEYPLPPIAVDALLFLWRVSSMQEEAHAVMRKWGFTPKTELVWVKLSRGGEKLHFGMGRILRAAHETCLVGARGKYRDLVLDHSTRSVLLAPVVSDELGIVHSAKPDAFYELVERLTPGPRAELFARVQRPGFRQWGRELPRGAESPFARAHERVLEEHAGTFEKLTAGDQK